MSGVEISYLGIDVGGTKVALRVEGAGRPPRETMFRWSPTGTARDDLDALAREVGTLLSRWPEPVRAVGVAMPALLDDRGRVVSWPGRPTWAGVPVTAELRATVPGARVACADDGDLAALAEAGEAGCAHVVYLGVGTGVGGGLVLDGRPWPGLDRASCELGHVVVDRSGPRCDCGRRGCLQAVASGPAVLRRATELHGATVGFDDLRRAYAQRRSWACRAVEEACAALAAAIVSLAEMARPSLALVGGGFAAALPGFVPTVAARVTELARVGVPVPQVRPAALGGLSSLRGAVLLARAS